jgi:hypothetical protein
VASPLLLQSQLFPRDWRGGPQHDERRIDVRHELALRAAVLLA